jgi:hypothetical protein
MILILNQILFLILNTVFAILSFFYFNQFDKNIWFLVIDMVRVFLGWIFIAMLVLYESENFPHKDPFKGFQLNLGKIIQFLITYYLLNEDVFEASYFSLLSFIIIYQIYLGNQYYQNLKKTTNNPKSNLNENKGFLFYAFLGIGITFYYPLFFDLIDFAQKGIGGFIFYTLFILNVLFRIIAARKTFTLAISTEKVIDPIIQKFAYICVIIILFSSLLSFFSS